MISIRRACCSHVVQDGDDLAEVFRSKAWDRLEECLWAAAWPVVVALAVVGVAMVLVAWRLYEC